MPWPDRFYTQSGDRRRQIQWFAVTILILIIVCIILDIFWHGSDMAKRVVCGAHLREIGIAIRMYADDNGGVYPPEERWAVTIIPYLDGLYLYFCPADNQIRPIRHRKRHQLPISYWYREPHSNDMETARTPLSGDRMYSNYLGNHKNGGNVVYADNHVSWRSLEQWEKQGLPTESYIDWKKSPKRIVLPYTPRPRPEESLAEPYTED